MKKAVATPGKSWEIRLAEGRQAFYDNPSQSLRGKDDVFRQGFYAAQETGYTHLVSYTAKSPVTGLPVKVEFRTTADAVKHHRRSLKCRGIKSPSVSKL